MVRPPQDGRVPVLPDAVASDLGGLDVRTWAQLLRALRRVGDVPEAVGALLALPTSELAAGQRRDELAQLIGADEGLSAALLADPALPSAAHGVLSQAGEPGEASEASKVEGTDQPEGTESVERDRAAVRLRDLRREVADLRRQRDGAQARAAVAEMRAAELEAARSDLVEQVAGLEAQLLRVRDEVAQGVSRAERKSAGRTDELERALAAERSALELLRRERDRDRVQLDALRDELEQLRARPVVVPAVAAAPRPLVLPDELAEGTTEAARWLLERARVLLVDGYNVSLALRGSHPLSEQRRWLIDRLRPLAARGGVVPIVVFDGEGAGSVQRDASGTEVRFTAGGTIADDEIVFATAATDDPVLVITDDAELQERVLAEGGNVLGTVYLLGAVDG